MATIPEHFAQLFDDAALFPPGNAPLDRAVADHRDHRAGELSDLIGPFVVSDLLLAYGHGSEGGPADDSNAPVLPDQVDELRRQLLAGEISWYPKPSAAEK